MPHCNQCEDLIHNNTKKSHISATTLNVVLVFNLGILWMMYSCGSMDEYVMFQVLVAGVMLFAIRTLLMLATQCYASPHPQTPYQPWNTLSLRLMFSLVVTLYICQSAVPLSIKGISIGMTTYIAMYEIFSRCSYTSDAIATVLLTYLVVRSIYRHFTP